MTNQGTDVSYREIIGGVCAPKGFLAAGVHCGIRKNKKKNDIALIVSERRCNAAAVYTKNQVKAAPILVTKKHLSQGKAQGVIANSGNANACAVDGEANARRMAAAAATLLDIPPEDMIVASTGVIGVPLEIDAIEAGMPSLVHALSKEGSSAAAEAIMTTDTYKKEYAVSFSLGDHPVRIGGISKGSGMIHPNMGTTLTFLTTDAAIDKDLLQKMLAECVKVSFNRISVDGDTSTNDMVSILANGMAENPEIVEDTEEAQLFYEALRGICIHLARELARDGEGATRLIACTVEGAFSEEKAEQMAKAVISSSLTKAAMFGGDANWGRVLCAMGYSGATFDYETVEIRFRSQAGELTVCERGRGVAFDEHLAKRILSMDEIEIWINLHEAEETATAWGCDLTYKYVKINGDYRS